MIEEVRVHNVGRNSRRYMGVCPFIFSLVIGMRMKIKIVIDYLVFLDMRGRTKCSYRRPGPKKLPKKLKYLSISFKADAQIREHFTESELRPVCFGRP